MTVQPDRDGPPVTEAETIRAVKAGGLTGQPDLTDGELEKLAGLLGQWADTHAATIEDRKLLDAAGRIIHNIDEELESHGA